MTCIVAVKENGSVWMGADSAGVDGRWNITTRVDPKVYRVKNASDEFLIGFTTSFRMGQILGHKFSPPEQPASATVEKYMATTFIDAVRECLKSGGFAKKDHDQEEGGEFLVGYRGRIFKVESDFQVGESVEDFNACGCGESYALGALYVLDPEKGPRNRVMLALMCAEKFSSGVRGPFGIEELAPAKETAA